jgi:hypothetical protein
MQVVNLYILERRIGFMDNSIRTNLCKGLRACGIPKNQTHQILNEVEKWYRENGVEWTNSRIKDLRQWYETCLTGCPKPPGWFKHSKEGYPLGIWSWVFGLKPAKALGVLSLNTVFFEDKLSETQKEKFLHGLAGNKSQNPDVVKEAGNCGIQFLPHRKKMPELSFPTLFDMTGSIPCHESQSSVRPNGNIGEALKALRLSWEDVPQVTFDFLIRQNLIGYMPMDIAGNQYQLELNRPHSRTVGRVSVLQQPQLKARIVGNPNRVLQVTLEPLKAVYMEAARNLPTDVTFDQESGVLWTQTKLRQGIELAGSDLTSASDLLDVQLSLSLVDKVFGFPKIQGYQDYEEYFFEVSRSKWWCSALNREVQWEQGDVLGTGPSFGLLTLTNNAAAICAWKQARADGVDLPSWKDSFRVVGDDIVMVSDIAPYYTRIIEGLGGEINHSKTLKSNRVAEFAGRVITANCSYLKAVKYSEPSDNSFMSYVAQLGDQAKYLLMPKQRSVYELLKPVPGLLVPGPWMQDSYGIPLGDRYSWYLEEVEPALSRIEPDLELADYEMLLLKASLTVAETDQNEHKAPEWDEPMLDDGYLPSQVTPTFKVGGDPRLTDGKSALEVLYQHIRDKDITPFDDWIRDRHQTSQKSDSLVETSQDPILGSEPNETRKPNMFSPTELRKSLLERDALIDRLKANGTLQLSNEQDLEEEDNDLEDQYPDLD